MIRLSHHVGRWAAIGVLALAAAVGGCAGGGVDISAHGSPPQLGRGLLLADPVETPLAGAVAAGLRAHGVELGANAPYLLEIAAGERPGQVGGYVTRAASGQSQDWSDAPRPRPWWRSKSPRVCTLAARLSSRSDGTEVYRVQATVEGKGQACGREAALADGVVAALTGSAPAAR